MDISPSDFFLWGYLKEDLLPKTSLNNATQDFDCSCVVKLQRICAVK
jgi:hypothetical protein